MNKLKFLTVSVIVLLVLNAVTLFILFHMQMGPKVFGHGAHGGGGVHDNPRAYIVKELNLDEQQQKQFEGIIDEHHTMLKNSHRDEGAMMDEYFNLLKKDNPDKAILDSIAERLGAQRKNLAYTAFNHFMTIRNICRPDQKPLFDKTLDKIKNEISDIMR